MKRTYLERLLLVVALLAPVGAIQSQRPAPFQVGEELVFKATFGIIPAGTAKMRVESIDTVRGRPAYHITFAIDGGIIGFRIHDRYESWMDVETLSSLTVPGSPRPGALMMRSTYRRSA